MNFSFIILTLLAVVCLSISIRILFDSIFQVDSIRDSIEEKMYSLTEFISKERFTIFSVKFRILEILFLVGIILTWFYRLIRFLW